MSEQSDDRRELDDVIDRLARLAYVHTKDDHVIVPIRRRLIRRAAELTAKLERCS